MFTFADMMRQAQGGQAIDNIAAAYGLKRTDVEKLMSTLLPLYAVGLRRAFQDMKSPATLTDVLDPVKFRAAFDDAREAVSPAATEAARIALERVFGSGEAATVIADQAAAATGVGADVVSKVMPAMAATVFGGIVKNLEDSPLAPVLKAWNGTMGRDASAFDVLTNPYRDAMKAFLKGYAEGPPKKKTAGVSGIEWPDGMEGWGKLFDAGFEMNEASRRAFESVYGIKLG